MSAPTSAPHRPGGSGHQALASGVVAFAAVMLILAGFLSIFRGIMAIAEDPVFVRTPRYVFEFSLAGWGWVHLVLGVLALGVAVGLFRLALWARVVGVLVAVLLMITNFLTVPYYPLWSLTLIAVNGLVVWGLCAVREEGPAGG
ncbi:hypothetical protein ACFW1A_18735 [Kitasatospora sp. NPDC058965]|uniref:DUF7144 family membrane protein n=1 Tax=Kitasatospora sp. NPDC058965 TaxID=3346682 RepID=UPI0036C704BE